ncbi:hypothetical protein [Myroides sp. N17-2]|uniref:hypothetical protein n=1 Tax=Myroides sp. N17-2 TaxID=2030799 RepID=UPI00117F6895|nr:hypothetical protein [Myroides sp. N17-2]
MKIFDIYYKSIFLFLLLVFSISVNGQTVNRGARISDNSVTKENGNRGLYDLGILDLESIEKGFLLPRMSTNQRDAIVINESNDKGLLIFNTSTGCVNYYNSTKKSWVSLCGDILPAIFTITSSQCNDLKVLGNYYQDRELDGSNGIVVSVTVAKAGMYEVLVSTNNGYAFRAKGTFPDTGVYQIYLKGDGKPKIGHSRDLNTGEPLVPGDLLTISLNGLKSTCVDKYNFVEKPMPNFKITNAVANGKYLKGVEVDASNTMTVTVNVTQGGKLVFYTSLANGVEFKGTKIVNSTGITTVVLQSSGTPIDHGVFPIIVFGNSKFNVGDIPESFTSSFKTEDVSFSIVECDKISYGGQAVQDEALTSGHTMKVQVQVIAPGITTLFAKNNTNSQNIVYSSGTVVLDYVKGESNIKEITLTATSGVTKSVPIIDLTFSGLGLDLNNTCIAKLPVKAKPLDFRLIEGRLFSPSFIYNKISYVTPKTDMEKRLDGVRLGDSFTMLVKVKVIYAGDYEVETIPINGVYFKGKGTFDKTEEGSDVTITLKAYGHSGVDLPTVQYHLTTNSTVNHNENLNVDVDFVYRSMNMYSIGGGTGQSWQPGGFNGPGSYWFSGPRVVRTLKNFGWDGVVRIAGLRILGISNLTQTGPGVDYTKHFTTNATEFGNNLLLADMVFIGANNGNNFNKNTPQLIALADYIKESDGVLVYGEGNASTMNSFLSNIPTGSFISTASAGTSGPFVAVSSNPENASELILGKKGTYFSTGSANNALYSKLLAGHDNGTTILFSNLPDDFISLVGGEKDDSFTFVHKSLGFVGVGSSTFMGGYVDNRATSTSYPLNASTGGDPLVKSYGNKGDVYNSWFLLNLVHWAIDYAQEHQPNKVRN